MFSTANEPMFAQYHQKRKKRTNSKPGRRMNNKKMNTSKPFEKIRLSANGLNSPLKGFTLVCLKAIPTVG